MFSRAGQPTLLCCDTVCEGGVWEGTVPLALFSAGFQSLLLLPTITLGPSGADFWVDGFVYVLGPCGCLRWTLLWGWEFLPLLPQPPQVFLVRYLRLYFPKLEPWVAWSVSLPSCYSWFICTWMWDHPVHQPLLCHESSPPGCPFLPLLPVWLNVSSLSPWLLDFHRVWYSVSSGWVLFFKFVVVLLLVVRGSTVCVYLCLHLGQKLIQKTHNFYWPQLKNII